MYWVVVVSAMGGACLGMALASWITAGARAEESAERVVQQQQQAAQHRAELANAEKRGYDSGWDACDLMHKRKRQAAALQAAQTRKNGGRRAS